MVIFFLTLSIESSVLENVKVLTQFQLWAAPLFYLYAYELYMKSFKFSWVLTCYCSTSLSLERIYYSSRSFYFRSRPSHPISCCSICVFIVLSFSFFLLGLLSKGCTCSCFNRCTSSQQVLLDWFFFHSLAVIIVFFVLEHVALKLAKPSSCLFALRPVHVLLLQ